MMVAVNDGTGLQYLLTDHLGSTVAVTNQSGTLTSQQRYLPFGAARTIPNSPILGTDFTYTGQRKLDEGMGGIMDYKARFYSPALGRFLQPDTIIPDQTNPQSWNRFSYVRNNPILFNDPTGHKELCDEMLDCRYVPTPPLPPTKTPTPLPTNTPSPTPSNTPSPSATPTPQSSKDEAIDLFQYSPTAQLFWNPSYSVEYNPDGTCEGHSGNPIIVAAESCGYSPTDNAGTIIHEIVHKIIPHNGTLLEEYQAFLIGDLVRSEIIAATNGNPNDMRHKLTEYTVDLNAPRDQLKQQLEAWFQRYQPEYVTDRKNGGYCVCPALPTNYP